MIKRFIFFIPFLHSPKWRGSGGEEKFPSPAVELVETGGGREWFSSSFAPFSIFNFQLERGRWREKKEVEIKSVTIK
jgi:hypothetical protein